MAVPEEPLGDGIDQLIPVDDEQATDAEEAANFGDESLLDAEPLVVEEEDPPPFGRSWAFDFVVNRFLPRPGGGPQDTRGLTTLRFWVEKCLRTERAVYPIHDADYGLEGVHDLVGAAQDSDAWDGLGEKVRDALMFHPRITDVTDFLIDSDPDDEVVFISFRVVVDEGDEALQISDLALTA